MPYNPYAYQMPTYYGQPMPDNLTQLRQGVGYQSPMMQQPTAQTAQATPSIIWVQGEEGAKAYMVRRRQQRVADGQRKQRFLHQEHRRQRDAAASPRL